jgi:hypothetical protein
VKTGFVEFVKNIVLLIDGYNFFWITQISEEEFYYYEEVQCVRALTKKKRATDHVRSVASTLQVIISGKEGLKKTRH